MTDTGYWGDIEADERRCDDVVSRPENAGCIFPHRQQFFAELPKRRPKRKVPRLVRDQFFGELPRRRQKRNYNHFGDASSSSSNGEEATAATRPRSVSQYYSARWLNQYFLNQNITTTQNATHKIVSPSAGALKPVTANTLTMGNQVVPLITSCHHIFVEDAISFSPIPRVVIEADVPHRVVHTNAAYERHYGTVLQEATSHFEVPFVKNHRDLELAVGSLFVSVASLIMYPVCGSDREEDGVAIVTHFLIEAKSVTPLVVADPIDNNHLFCKTKTQHPWREAAAHAIA